MLGLLVIIVISWVLLRFIGKENLKVLGIATNQKQVLQFIIGCLFIMLTNVLIIYAESIVLKVDWELNNVINYNTILNSFIYHIRSAMTEDLIFRGAILYLLIKKIGSQKAMILSALAFGIYHVFSYGITGERIIVMLYIVLITGFTGYVWAYTFCKTKSIMMALGFHLGYNFLMTLFYESAPYGELIFIELSKINLNDWNWLFYNLIKGLLPSIITLVFVKQYVKRKLNIAEKPVKEIT